MHTVRKEFTFLVAAAAIAASITAAGPLAAGPKSGGGGKSGGSAKPAPEKPKEKTLLEVVTGDASLSKFAAAVKAAGLESLLKGGGKLTVLAPNDAAIAKLDAGVWDDLMKPASKDKLKALVQGHVVTSKMTAADIAKAKKLSCEGGASHEIKIGDDKAATIDGARIVSQDVPASNGLVQVLDSVLLPPAKDAAKAPPATK